MSRKGLAQGLLMGSAALGSLALINARIARDSVPLEWDCTDPVLRAYWWRYGIINYRVAGTGSPLLLLHGIHAAASGYEMRHQVRLLADHFRVYVPDLLGFGYSDRPPIAYTASTYAELIGDLVRDVIGEPTDVVASSLSAAYAVANAARRPDLFRRLVLACPAGVGSLSSPPSPVGNLLYALLRSPVVGTALFNALTSRASLRYYLAQQTFFDADKVTAEMVEDYWRVAHQPGGQWAPAAFLGQRLNLDASRAWCSLSQPVLLVWGAQARPTPVETAQRFLHLRPSTPLEILDRCGILPHDEQADQFSALVRGFLGA
jgi:pimeloyl-ACP methyl ester carboxylesterase